MKRAALLAATALLALVRCREPTYVDLVLTTDIPCERVRGVAITVGSLGPLEQRLPATSTLQCGNGTIGDISVVPSGSDDGEFGVRVVMGIDRGVESCVAPDYGDGCVVARRGLRFVPHDPLTLPIVLRQICNGIPCGPLDTCVKGICRPATIKDPSACKGGSGCGEDVLVPANSGTATPLPLATYCGSSSVDLSAPWPMTAGCPTRAGRSSARGPQQARTPLVHDPGNTWTADRRRVPSNVLVDTQNRAFSARLVGTTETFGVLPLGGGALLANIPGTTGECILLTTGHVRCFGTEPAGDLFDVDVPTDTLVASRSTPARFSDGVVRLLDGWAFTPSGVVYATTAATGASTFKIGKIDATGVKWEQPLDDEAFPLALSRDGQSAWVTSRRSLQRFDVTSGTPTTNLYPAGETSLGPPTVTEDDAVMVVLQTASGPTLRRYSATGAQLDSTPIGGTSSNMWSVALGTGAGERRAYVYAPGAPVTAVRYPGGGVAWTAPSHAAALLVAADEVLYVVTDVGDRVVALRPDDGTTLWQAPVTAGPSPKLALAADGALCVGTAGNGITCFPR